MTKTDGSWYKWQKKQQQENNEPQSRAKHHEVTPHTDAVTTSQFQQCRGKAGRIFPSGIWKLTTIGLLYRWSTTVAKWTPPSYSMASLILIREAFQKKEEIRKNEKKKRWQNNIHTFPAKKGLNVEQKIILSSSHAHISVPHCPCKPQKPDKKPDKKPDASGHKVSACYKVLGLLQSWSMKFRKIALDCKRSLWPQKPRTVL